MGVDVSIRIGGQAGQGLQSISFIVGKVCTRHGYSVFINQDVEPRIRAGHNFNQIKVAAEPVHAINDKVELLIALDKHTIDEDFPS